MDFLKKYWIIFMLVFMISMFIKPALCFLLLGSIASFIGIDGILFSNEIEKHGIELTGKIVEYQSDREGHKTPVIDFTTVAGEHVREKPYYYTSTDLSKILTYENEIDQPVSILYHPRNPKKFVLANETGLNYAASSILILIGLFFAGLSISSFLGFITIFQSN